MWQRELLDRVTRRAESTTAIVSLRPFGSVVDDTLDQWSDLDLELTVLPDRLGEVFPDTSWLSDIGPIYTSSSSHDEDSATLRVVFEDLRRLDLRFVPADRRARFPPSLPHMSPRSAVEQMISEFVFEAMLATFKVARDDLLIGGHLVLGLERKVLELAMILRDQALGTSVHRHGGRFNEVALGLNNGGFGALSLLSRIESATNAFDSSARQLEPSFTQNWEPLLTFVALVRSATPSAQR